MRPVSEEQKRLVLQYGSIFSGPAGDAVLRDLARICEARPTILTPEQWQSKDRGEQKQEVPEPVPIDPFAAVSRESRRAVYWHIHGMVELAGAMKGDPSAGAE